MTSEAKIAVPSDLYAYKYKFSAFSQVTTIFPLAKGATPGISVAPDESTCIVYPDPGLVMSKIYIYSSLLTYTTATFPSDNKQASALLNVDYPKDETLPYELPALSKT